MKDPLKLIKLGYKIGLTSIAVSLMVLSGLALNNSSIFASVDWDNHSPYKSPEPSPTPSPAPPACNDCGGDVDLDVEVDNGNNIENENINKNENENENNNKQDQNQEQEVNVTQENNQTVNVTNTVPEVAGTTTAMPLKQPETGVGVLGMMTMAGAIPLGFALSRFGRGQIISGKKEESLSEFAKGLVNFRSGKSQDK